MSDDEIIAVVQAHKEGKQIQARMLGFSGDQWSDLSENKSVWDFARFDYRIKPEPHKPREFWINLYKGKPSSHPTKESADKYVLERDECIHVREVLDDSSVREPSEVH